MPFPAPEDLPDLGIKPMSLGSPAVASGSFTTLRPGKLFLFKFKEIVDFVLLCSNVTGIQPGLVQDTVPNCLRGFFFFLTIPVKISKYLQCYREKAMAPHSSTLAWKTPWMEEPGRLQSMGLRRVGHD